MSPLRVLVLDAYSDEGRRSLTRGGCTHASELYRKMLTALDPAVRVDIHFPKPQSRLPEGVTLSDYDGVVWTGSNLTIHKENDEVRAQVELTRACFRAGISSFGSCWAVHLAVVAAGGACAPNPRGREFGIARNIRLTPVGRAHPMFERKANVFSGYTSHEDEVTHVPPGAQVLAENEFSRVQAVHVAMERGEFWAVQYHPEYALLDIAQLSVVRAAQLITQGDFEDEDDAQRYFDELSQLAAEPNKRHIAWRHGIDHHVLSDQTRTLEVDNWLRRLRGRRSP